MLGRIWRRRAPPHRCSDAQRDPRLARAEEAIAGLPKLTREVFFMHRFEDLSYERIARRLGIDAREVERHIAATLVALRHALKEFDSRRRVRRAMYLKRARHACMAHANNFVIERVDRKRGGEGQSVAGRGKRGGR